jgi:chemotaxis protein MotA
MEGGELKAFVNAPAMVVVFGGTFGAALISFPGATVSRLPAMLLRCFVHRAPARLEVARTLVRLSERARREGLLALEEELEGIENPLLRRGITLVIDGTDPELVRGVLESVMDVEHHEAEGEIAVLEAMGGYAPTMGIIGTVMGLVHVLGSLSDPTKLGSAIAVAFIATFFGVASANLLWLPMASKLKKQTQAEQFLEDMILAGISSIQAGENPRILQERLEPYLPKNRKAESSKEQEANAVAGAFKESIEPGKA